MPKTVEVYGLCSLCSRERCRRCWIIWERLGTWLMGCASKMKEIQGVLRAVSGADKTDLRSETDSAFSKQRVLLEASCQVVIEQKCPVKFIQPYLVYVMDHRLNPTDLFPKRLLIQKYIMGRSDPPPHRWTCSACPPFVVSL